MLPYFNYEVPEENMEGELFAKPEEFLDQTKGGSKVLKSIFEKKHGGSIENFLRSLT